MKILPWTIASLILVSSVWIVSAQSPGDRRPRAQNPATPNPNTAVPEPGQEVIETLKIDTNLVTVPVIASSRTGKYITDLRKEEFKLTENGVPQEIAFLATVNAPFYVVLMLDTSDSTREQLRQIQRAAITFLDQLGPRDRVKIVSFDTEVRDWNGFTSDKAILRAAIEKTVTGTGTRVYDAVQTALDALRPIASL